MREQYWDILHKALTSDDVQYHMNSVLCAIHTVHMTAPTCIPIYLMATGSQLLASTAPHTPPVRQFLCANPKPGTSPSPGQRTD